MRRLFVLTATLCLVVQWASGERAVVPPDTVVAAVELRDTAPECAEADVDVHKNLFPMNWNDVAGTALCLFGSALANAGGIGGARAAPRHDDVKRLV